MHVHATATSWEYMSRVDLVGHADQTKKLMLVHIVGVTLLSKIYLREYQVQLHHVACFDTQKVHLVQWQFVISISLEGAQKLAFSVCCMYGFRKDPTFVNAN